MRLAVIREITLAVVVEVRFPVERRVPIFVTLRIMLSRVALDRVLPNIRLQTLDGAHPSHIVLLVRFGWPVEPDEWNEPALVLHEFGEELENGVAVLRDLSRLAFIVRQVELEERVEEVLDCTNCDHNQLDPDVLHSGHSTQVQVDYLVVLAF